MSLFSSVSSSVRPDVQGISELRLGLMSSLLQQLRVSSRTSDPYLYAYCTTARYPVLVLLSAVRELHSLADLDISCAMDVSVWLRHVGKCDQDLSDGFSYIRDDLSANEFSMPDCDRIFLLVREKTTFTTDGLISMYSTVLECKEKARERLCQFFPGYSNEFERALYAQRAQVVRGLVGLCVSDQLSVVERVISEMRSAGARPVQLSMYESLLLSLQSGLLQ